MATGDRWLPFVPLTWGFDGKPLPLVSTRDRRFPIWCEHGVSMVWPSLSAAFAFVARDLLTVVYPGIPKPRSGVHGNARFVDVR